MSHARAKLVVNLQLELGESPVWYEQLDSLFGVDVARPGRLWRLQVSSQIYDSWLFDEALTNVTLAAAGRLLVASERKLFLFDPLTGAHEDCTALPALQRSYRFNDGACDSKGRLWIGTMENSLDRAKIGMPLNRVGAILSVNADGAIRRFDEQLGCPNALAWSPDNSTFYYADSSDGCIYSTRFDAEAGSFSQRRHFFSAPNLGLPDGAAVDVEGYLWNARWGAGCVIRISPDGTLDRVVEVPTAFVTSCAFGDADRRTLYITTAKNGDDNPDAGALFAFRSPTAGLSTAIFGQVMPKLTYLHSG